MTTNATPEQLRKALARINKRYKGNITFKREPEAIGKRFRFTLTVNSAKNPGSRRGFNGQRVAAACWHAHGHFFDALFSVNPNATIISAGQRITKDAGNWQDRNIGSQVQPLMYSEACDCQNS